MSTTNFSFQGLNSIGNVGSLGGQGQNFNPISRNVPMGSSDMSFQARRTRGNPIVRSYTMQPNVPSFRNVQTRVNSQFSNTVSTSSLPNLTQMMNNAGMNMTYQSNRPSTFTIIPRPITKALPYDRYISKGDILFVFDDDKLHENHRQTPQRTVMNYQSLNRYIYFRKARAVKLINDLTQKQTKVKEIWPPCYDPDMLIKVWKRNNTKLYENRMARIFDVGRGVNRSVEKIMEERIKKMEESVDELSGTGEALVDGIGWLKGFLKGYRTAWDQNVNKSLLFSLDHHCDEVIHLHPALLCTKYKLLGPVMNLTAHRSDNFPSYYVSEYGKQMIATMISSGPAEILNIFGPPNSSKNKYRGKFNKMEFRGPKLNKMSELHLAFVIDNSEELHMVNNVQFRPTWLVPFCTTSKYNLINRLEKNYPLVCETGKVTHLDKNKIGSSKKKKKSVWIPRSLPTSYFVGKIIDLNGPDPDKKPGFYSNAIGTLDWSKTMGMDNVLELRKKAGLIKIDVRQI